MLNMTANWLAVAVYQCNQAAHRYRSRKPRQTKATA